VVGVAKGTAMSKLTDLMKNRGMSYTEAARELRHPLNQIDMSDPAFKVVALPIKYPYQHFPMNSPTSPTKSPTPNLPQPTEAEKALLHGILHAWDERETLALIRQHVAQETAAKEAELRVILESIPARCHVAGSVAGSVQNYIGELEQKTAKLRNALIAIETSPMAPFDSFEAALNRAKAKATEALGDNATP
jgi:hypothetical protein